MMQAEAIKRAKDHAPYLADSLTLFPELAQDFAGRAPDLIIEDLLQGLHSEIETLDAEMETLRILKRKIHLVTALADIAQIWTWTEVTEQLTTLADICMNRIMRAVASEAGIDGTPDNPAPGLFVLAVGKYGARELNYSSDIDFNVFYDPDIISLPNMARAERTLIKFVQKLIAGFERQTHNGYIFRTDLRLRPDPRSNAVAVSTLTAERYYESLGQNWERAAMIKARVCGGDMKAGQDFINNVLTPFIWRRNLDYAAIEDIHSIKRQIHAGKGGTDINPAGHHLKLGKGGIREIEFYAQVQQLILGGRHEDMRTPRTVDALAALAKAGFSDGEDTDALTQHYAFLRKLEHCAQMMRDEQTHIAPEDPASRADLAVLAGFGDLAVFDAKLGGVLTDVHERYINLFPDADSLSSDAGNLVFTGVEPEPETLKTFAELGYENGPAIWQDMAGWLGGRVRATKTERARELLTRLAPELIEICAETGQPDRAFDAFSKFFTKVFGGVSLLSMFVQTPTRLAQIINMMVNSDRVAETLAANPAILDAMVDPDFLTVTQDNLAEGFVRDIRSEDDFETAMNAARRRVREDHFRISAGALLGTMTVDETPPLITQIADSALQALLPIAKAEAERRGEVITGEFAVLGLGKLGGRELSLTSDLDIMLIYEPDADSEAQRPYTKLTQSLISALSAVTEEGAMFEVDMALRPSGRAGPVAVSLEAFTRYYAEKAWTWEFMALSRARVVAASTEAFAARLSKIVSQAISEPRPDLDMPPDIKDMLARTKQEKKPRGPWDIKNLDGGLRDLEFIAQSLLLKHRDSLPDVHPLSTKDMLMFANSTGSLGKKQMQEMLGAAKYYLSTTQAFTLTRGSLEGDVKPSALSTIANLTGHSDSRALKAQLDTHLAVVKQSVKDFMGNPKRKP